MTAVPILADFVIRLSFGLSIAALLISWRAVPMPFFRTQAQVILGLLVLGALVQARSAGQSLALWGVIAAAVSSYLSCVSWGLGLPRLGIKTLGAVALLTTAWLIDVSSSTDWRIWASNGSGRMTSGLLLGVTLTAMLLGHYYLTAPSMSTEPLRRVVLWIAVALVARCVLAGISLGISQLGLLDPAPAPAAVHSGLFLSARWGMGFLGTAVATYLTWKTVEIRSTQSATGILYITMIFVLFGELTSLILAGYGGILC